MVDYGVTVPDLPGCFSAGSTIDEAILNAEEAILTHIEGLLMDDEIVPPPSKIDNFANGEGETRSGFLTHAALEYITRHSLR